MEKRKFRIVVATYRVIVEDSNKVDREAFDDYCNIKVKQNGREFKIVIKGETIEDCDKMFKYTLKNWFNNCYIRLAIYVKHYKSYDTFDIMTEDDIDFEARRFNSL